MNDLEKKIEDAGKKYAKSISLETEDTGIDDEFHEEDFVKGAMSPEAAEFHKHALRIEMVAKCTKMLLELKATLYTEEEVQKLLIKCVDYIDAGMPTMESEIIDWFEQNKKKS